MGISGAVRWSLRLRLAHPLRGTAEAPHPARWPSRRHDRRRAAWSDGLCRALAGNRGTPGWHLL